MLRRTAFVGCVLMSAGCLYADDPTESSDALTYTSGMADTTPTRNLGFQNIDEDLQTPAGILYDNGTPDYANGNEMTAWTQANDFTLKGEAMIEHVNFSVLDTAAGSNLANWDGTGSWAIWTDGGAGPGSVIASGIGTNFTTNFDSNNGSWDFWDFGMDLDSPTCLDAGTYWLALHLNRDCTFRANLYWSTTAGGSGSGHYEDGGCAGSFNGPANEHSFNLEGSDGCGDCLAMKVSRLVGGEKAEWAVAGATPGEQVAIVYGFGPGSTGINGFAGYCATFGIQGVNANKVICTKAADGGGFVSCTKAIPSGASGVRVLSQAAERNTCPDECVSNIDDQVVG